MWYQALDGLVLDQCIPDATDPGALQETACLLGAPAPTPPYVFPSNYPDELFYFRATSQLTMPNGSRSVLVLALEMAFANGVPQAGQQMVFSRIRVTSGVPFDGKYRVTHPYGTETFDAISSNGGSRDIFFTEDVGLTPGVFSDALKSRVGPFLQRADASGNKLGFVTLNGAKFLSDGVATETVTGSPFGTNYFEICGPMDGPSNPERCLRTDQFTLTGRVREQPISSPLAVARASYSRTPSGAYVNVIATAVAGVGAAQPRLSAAAGTLPSVLMNGPDQLGRFYAQALPMPTGVLAPSVTVINFADVPPSTATQTLSDDVTVLSANYDPNTQSLVVVATSSDKGDGYYAYPPALRLDGFASATATTGAVAGDPASAMFTVTGLPVPPSSVDVRSAVGGRGQADVSIAASATPFPAGSPLAVDDSVVAVAGSAEPVVINVKANDVGNPGAPILAGAVTIAAPGLTPAIGTLVANADGTVSFIASQTVGTATFKYQVANAVGVSNLATVTIAVTAPPGGAVPIANPDPAEGSSINVNAGKSVVIDVLANDSGNGGVLNPASVAITTLPAAGTATVDPTSGKITYTAPTTAGTQTFQYRVANSNGNFSAPAAVTVNVVTPEVITLTRTLCQLANNWDIRGTSSVIPGNSVTVYLTPTVPTSPTAAQTIGTAAIDALGNFQLRVRGPNCTSPVSLKSAVGTKINNIAITIR